MSDPKQLVRRLRELAAELKRAAIWNGTGLAVDATKDDYLYELVCYFHLALSALPVFELRVGGALGATKVGRRAAKWPKKPGHKANFSYLSLRGPGGKEVFQLCPGICVTDIHGKDRAPDVNLLVGGAPAKPSHHHLCICWDAKYTSRPDSRLPDTAVSDFAFTFQQLGQPSPPASWLANVTSAVSRRSGLITNGEQSTEPSATLSAHGILETNRFPDGPPMTRP